MIPEHLKDELRQEAVRHNERAYRSILDSIKRHYSAGASVIDFPAYAKNDPEILDSLVERLRADGFTLSESGDELSRTWKIHLRSP